MRKRCRAAAEEVQEAHRGCNPPSVPTTHVSYYAAQLAWWLAFFPPERFLILTSTELHSPDSQLEVRAASLASPPHPATRYVPAHRACTVWPHGTFCCLCRCFLLREDSGRRGPPCMLW